jgi:YidC/Oxa1 family membrane protein insertase
VGILNPLYTAVAWVLKEIYSWLSPVFGPASGWTWLLSIVILVVFMRLLMVPLFIKQIHTTRAMSALTPQMNALRKKYKNDKQALNQEMMKLYQEAGVNPLMGCLPVVLQLPVWFALFNVLRAVSDWKPPEPTKYGLTQEMVASAQHAKIFGATIADKVLFTGTLHVPTEAKVVIVIAVLISMATTYLTVRQSMKRGMMPTATPDNPMAQSQKYMAYIMPLFALSGLYWQFGLVLYWVTTNLWTLGQQYVLLRRYPQVPAGAAAAETTAPALAPSRPQAPAAPGRRAGLPRSSPNGSAAGKTGTGRDRRSPPATSGDSQQAPQSVLKRLTKGKSEPPPQPPEPEIKVVRQQRTRQSRSKRSGKR